LQEQTNLGLLPAPATGILILLLPGREFDYEFFFVADDVEGQQRIRSCWLE
jgi:hypothetical protein